MEDVLQELTNLGSAGVARALEGYTRWYLVSAIGWLVMGIVWIVGGYIYTKSDWFEDEPCIKYIMGYLVIFFGAMMIIYNLSTVCAPEAYAIHALINDVTP